MRIDLHKLKYFIFGQKAYIEIVKSSSATHFGHWYKQSSTEHLGQTNGSLITGSILICYKILLDKGFNRSLFDQNSKLNLRSLNVTAFLYSSISYETVRFVSVGVTYDGFSSSGSLLFLILVVSNGARSELSER